MSQELNDEELTTAKLESGDRPSLYALGLAVSAVLRSSTTAVVMVDALGRVRLMPSSSVQVLATPRLTDEELHAYPEDTALQLLLLQGDDEEQMIDYMARRKEAES